MLYTDDFLCGCPSTGQAGFCMEQTPLWSVWCLFSVCCQRKVENHKCDGIWIFLWVCDSSGETLLCNVVNPKMFWIAEKNFQMNLGYFAYIVGKRWWCVSSLLSSELSAILMCCIPYLAASCTLLEVMRLSENHYSMNTFYAWWFVWHCEIRKRILLSRKAA